MTFEYKMIPVPRTMSVKSGEDMTKVIADFLTDLVNNMSKEGWEFYRTDSYSIAQLPGCLGSLCGQKAVYENYNVACFRKPK